MLVQYKASYGEIEEGGGQKENEKQIWKKTWGRQGRFSEHRDTMV